MNVPQKLIAFAAVLVLAFAGAALVGAAIDPTDAPPERAGHEPEETMTEDHDSTTDGAASGHGAAAHGGPAATAVSGLAVADGGYHLRFEQTSLPAEPRVTLRFRIVDDRGRTVRDAFETQHDKRMHLIVVRRDTAAFRHVHPDQRPDGSWTVDVDLPDAGVYRAFADFRADGASRTLAADLFVPGAFAPRPWPAPTRVGRAVRPGGARSTIDVALDAPTLRAGRAAELTFAAREDGAPVDRLEPYLGAKGHLVALREGDLAFLHVHPTDDADDHGSDGHGDDDHGAGGSAAHETTFAATFPTAGRYRLFLQFRVDGVVHTVDYAVEVER